MNASLKEIYKNMLLIREAERLIQKEYSTNAMKTPMHLAIGAEAIPCGILPFFAERRVFGSYRNHHWYLETTKDMEGFFLELLGKQKAPCQGRAGSMHLCNPSRGMILTSAVVSTTIPIAVGDSWAGKVQNQSGQTIVFFGDGALEEGVFAESLNFTRLKNIPILLVCEDNDLAIHSTKAQRQSFEIKRVVETYNIPYLFANGEKVENVTAVAEKAKALLKSGPVFLHINYFRALEHVGISEDFHFNYRVRPDDIETAKDPVWNCRKSLLAAGHSADELELIEREVGKIVAGVYAQCLSEEDSLPDMVDRYLFKEKQ